MRIARIVLCSALLFATPQFATAQTLVREVRAALTRNDLAAADALVTKRRAEAGTTPEVLAALSWLGRGALTAKDYDRAGRYANDTERPLGPPRHPPHT